MQPCRVTSTKATFLFLFFSLFLWLLFILNTSTNRTPYDMNHSCLQLHHKISLNWWAGTWVSLASCLLFNLSLASFFLYSFFFLPLFSFYPLFLLLLFPSFHCMVSRIFLCLSYFFDSVKKSKIEKKKKKKKLYLL